MVITVCGVMFGSAVNANTLTTREKMDVAKLVMATEGYSTSHDEDYDRLASGERETADYTFTKGGKYAIVGFCDNDCSDFDLILKDSSGNTVDSDFEDDSAPILEFTAGSSGDYKLDAIMRDCSTSYCYYRIQAFRKD